MDVKFTGIFFALDFFVILLIAAVGSEFVPFKFLWLSLLVTFP